jgi:hypothetical protein
MAGGPVASPLFPALHKMMAENEEKAKQLLDVASDLRSRIMGPGVLDDGVKEGRDLPGGYFGNYIGSALKQSAILDELRKVLDGIAEEMPKDEPVMAVRR